MPPLFFNIDTNYSAEMASTGQTGTHAPQSTHASASITYVFVPSVIHSTGHSAAQSPQLVQSSALILCAIVNTPKKQSYYQTLNTGSLLAQQACCVKKNII